MQSQNSLFKESIIKFDSERYKLIISFLVRERSLIFFRLLFAKVAIILTILEVSVKLTCASSFL